MGRWRWSGRGRNERRWSGEWKVEPRRMEFANCTFTAPIAPTNFAADCTFRTPFDAAMEEARVGLTLGEVERLIPDAIRAKTWANSTTL
jgi:hypothetical protein